MINKINDAVATTFRSIPGVPGLQDENSNYKPELLTPWARMTNLPAEPSPVTIGYDRQLRFSGLIQLDYFAVSNSSANLSPVSTIVDWFNHKDNRFLNSGGLAVTILAAWRGTGVPDTDWYRVPVYLRYEAYS